MLMRKAPADQHRYCVWVDGEKFIYVGEWLIFQTGVFMTYKWYVFFCGGGGWGGGSVM